jgi:hypothetical protein
LGKNAEVSVLTPECDQGHSRNVSLTARITSGIIVKAQLKVAAVLVLMGMLAAPAATLATSCLSLRGESHHGCVPDCPMMMNMHQDSGMSVQAQIQPPNCCQLSSGRPEPATQLLAFTGGDRLAPPAAEVTAVSVSMVASLIRSPESAHPALPAPSQSALCTFLI